MTHNWIWGGVEQFDAGKAVIEVAFYYLAFVVVAGFVNAAVISQVLILLHVPNGFHWAIIVGFGIPGLAALWVGLRAGSNGTKGLVLRRMNPDAAPGIMNLTEGLCLTMGIEIPRVFELCEPQVNVGAFAIGNSRAVLVVTSGAIEEFSRLEFEAVIARELARVRSGQIFFEARLRALQKLLAPIFAFVVPRRQSPELAAQLIAGDLAAVYFTRYPTALISALGKMDQDPNSRQGNTSLRRRVLAPYWIHPELESSDLQARLAELRSY